MTAKPSVYYDGGCPVCSREIAYYRARDGAQDLEWVDVSGEQPTRLGPGLTPAQALARMHVRRADGTLVSGAAAFAEIWRAMPGFRWLGHLLAVPPITFCAEIAYRVFLVARKLWR